MISTIIMELDRVPKHLLVVGGGYIGLEFGQIFVRFGSKVRIIHRGLQLLSRENPDLAAEILKIFGEVKNTSVFSITLGVVRFSGIKSIHCILILLSHPG